MRGGQLCQQSGFHTGGFPQNDPNEKKKNGRKNLKSTIEALHTEKSG